MYMKKLKEYRQKFGYSYQMMADLLNISKTFYWQVENKKRRLSYQLAITIAKIFSVTPDQLFYEDFINN